MKTPITLIPVVALTTLTIPAFAQDSIQRDDLSDRTYNASTSVKHQHVRLDHLVGHAVELEPSASEKLEAAKDNADAEHPTAEITDVVVDLDSGRASWAVLSVGGFAGIGDRTVAVPYSRLKVQKSHDADSGVVLGFPCTKAQLEKMPVFDVDEAQDRGMASAVRVCEATWISEFGEGEGIKSERGAREASSDRADADEKAAVVTTAVAVKPVHFVMGSALLEAPVHATDGEFGSIDRILVKPESGQMNWAVLSSGGVLGMGDDLYLIPCEALTMKTDEDDEACWMLSKTLQEMKSCKPIEEEHLENIDEAHEKRCCEFFGVKRSHAKARK